MSTQSKIFILFIFLFGYNLSKAQEEHPGDFFTVEKTFDNSNIDGYNLYVPKSNIRQSDPFPLLIFFQGGLGVGGKVEKIYNWALPKMLKDRASLDTELDTLLLNTFVILMPHISSGQFYTNEDAIKEIILEVTNNHNIDSKRIYLTGLSRGGHGTWGLASRMPELFAAIAPICGGSHGIVNYAKLVDLPIWTSHNIGDGIVSYNETQETIGKIEAASEITFDRYSELDKVDYAKHDRIFISGHDDSHDAWTDFYNHAGFYKWLLKYEK